MHLLTLKRLTRHFTNTLVNVALKFYVVSLTSCNFNFYKQKPRASNCAEFALSLDTIIHNLEGQKCLLWEITWCIYAYLIHHINQKERYLIQTWLYTSTERKKKYLESLEMNISSSCCQNCKRHLHLNHLNLFSSLIHLYLSSIFGCS